MKKLNVGIIGSGVVAQIIHLPLLKKMNNIELTAICDIDKHKLMTVKQKFDIPQAYTNLEKFFVENEFDAVMILTPTNTHREVAEIASQYCKNLFIEKPIARSYKETLDMIKIFEKHKTKVMVGFNMRFRPDAMLLKSLVEAKEFGKPYLIRVGWFRPRSSMQSWFIKKSYAGGGVVMDLAINIIDLAMWMLNYPEIKSVKAHNFFLTTKEVEDTATAMIHTKLDSIITFEVSWTLSNESEFFYFNLFGTEGAGFLNPLRVFKQVGNSQMELLNPENVQRTNLYLKSFENELKHFFAAINGLGNWVSTPEEASTRMKLIESIYESAKKGREVMIR